MKHLRLALIFFAVVFQSIAHSADENPLAKLAWQSGPSVGVIGDKATIQIPKGYAFLNAVETKKFQDINQNFSDGTQYVLAPESLVWFSIFSFSPEGYIKDDEGSDANDISANKMLETTKKNTILANEERVKRGWGTMTIKGWRFQPHYDKQAKLLEWAYEAKQDSDNQSIINYNTRILGRTGVMQVVLVASPESLDTSISELKSAFGGYAYNAGESYTEFQQGDKVAEYGLAALIVGGAAAVAAKKGFFTVILAFLAGAWKFILVAIAGGFVWLKSLFTKKD
jgi:uncharacterized membrane-anchored protein